MTNCFVNYTLNWTLVW